MYVAVVLVLLQLLLRLGRNCDSPALSLLGTLSTMNANCVPQILTKKHEWVTDRGMGHGGGGSADTPSAHH